MVKDKLRLRKDGQPSSASMLCTVIHSRNGDLAAQGRVDPDALPRFCTFVRLAYHTFREGSKRNLSTPTDSLCDLRQLLPPFFKFHLEAGGEGGSKIDFPSLSAE